MQSIGRLQGLGIELHAGVGEALIHGRHLLQQVVVGRRDHTGTRVRQGFKHRLGQSRALARIGTHSDLVEGDECMPVGVAHDLGQVRHVRRERGQALADVLIVADVGADRIEDVDAGALHGGYLKAGASEQDRQGNGFEGYRLSPGVGTRYHQHVKALAQADVVGHRLVPGDDRVSQLGQPKHARIPELRFHRIHLFGELGARVGQVDGRENFQARQGRIAARRGARRELSKNAESLAFDLELGLFQAVVQIDQCLGLDEHRRARVGRVVDDAVHPPARIGADGQHVAVVAHGGVGVREGGGDGRVP